jgi:nitrite reductase/ring-hydroxylating ferredoxin subunit
MPRHVVATTDEIAPGTCKIVAVSGREIGVFNVHGEFYALVNRCPHEGAALCLGPVLGRFTADRPGDYRLTRHGEMLRCPWHGWEFDIRTGICTADRTRRVIRYTAEIRGNDVVVVMPDRGANGAPHASRD